MKTREEDEGILPQTTFQLFQNNFLRQFASGMKGH